MPADLRLLQTRGLKIEEAVLTGESVPVDKQKNLVFDGGSIGDQSNFSFSGTPITADRVRV